MSTSYTWYTGSKGSINPGSGVQMIDNELVGSDLKGIRPKIGIQIIADANNTDSVYVGKSTVTVATGSLTDGYPLAAGSDVLIPTNRVEEIYVRSGGGISGLAVNYIII